MGHIIEGVDGTGIKSGIISEIGLIWPLLDNKAKVLRAVVRVQQESGATLVIHTGRVEAAPMSALEIVEKAGGDLNQTIMDHIDQTLFRLEAMLEVVATGSYLEWDLFGHEASFWPISTLTCPTTLGALNG